MKVYETKEDFCQELAKELVKSLEKLGFGLWKIELLSQYDLEGIGRCLDVQMTIEMGYGNIVQEMRDFNLEKTEARESMKELKSNMKYMQQYLKHLEQEEKEISQKLEKRQRGKTEEPLKP